MFGSFKVSANNKVEYTTSWFFSKEKLKTKKERERPGRLMERPTFDEIQKNSDTRFQSRCENGWELVFAHGTPDESANSLILLSAAAD